MQNKIASLLHTDFPPSLPSLLTLQTEMVQKCAAPMNAEGILIRFNNIDPQ